MPGDLSHPETHITSCYQQALILRLSKLMHLRKPADQNSRLEQAVVRRRHCAWAWRTRRHRLPVALWEQLQPSQACQVLLLHHVWCRQQAADMSLY